MRRPPLLIVFAIALVGMFAISVAAAMASPGFDFFLQTGHLPVYKIDGLHAPVGVIGWNSNALVLVDGRTLSLPGLRGLPAQSLPLSEISKRGVEIGANGRVYGLVNINHWCGNDAVRKEIARVDIADMLMFLRLGEPLFPVPESDALAMQVGGRFDERGWEPGEFGLFRAWEELKSYDK